jgi:excisionase family DNA binding protein
VSLANPQARGGRVLDTQLGGHRDSVWEAEVLITEERKSIMGEESSTPVWALRQRGSGDGVAQLESHPDPRADPEARSASSTLVFRLTRAGETPEKRLQMSAVSSCYPPALSSNHAQGQLAGRQTQPPTGRKIMITPRSTVKSDVVPLMYRVDEAAAALRLSRSSVYELIRSGQLRSVKQGRRRLVPVTALADYVASLGGAA